MELREVIRKAYSFFETMKQLFTRMDFCTLFVITLAVFYPTSLKAQWVDKNESENYIARHECSVVQAGNKFYVMGGRESAKTIDVYNYAANTWAPISNSAPEEFNHFQATEYKGMIWVIGAFKTNAYPTEQPTEFIWTFNPANQEWIKGPLIPTNRRRGSTGLVVYNDKFYISGGNTIGHDGGYVSWFDEYDPATGTWTPLADAPRARDHFHAGVIGSKMYLAGGRLSGGAGGVFKPVIAEIDVYDFNTSQWSTLAQNLPTPRGAPAVAVFNNKLVVIGGEVQNENVYNEVNVSDALKITEQYDPATQTWTRIADLIHKRHGTQAIVSGNGIFVLAGSPNLAGGNQKNMEYFGQDAPVGSVSTASTLTAPNSLTVEANTSGNFDIDITGGNVGLIVRSMQISGAGATNFQITSGDLSNALLGAGSSNQVIISHNGAASNAYAILTINYGASSSVDIVLSSIEGGIVNPGTQQNIEGDNVSLQILTTGLGNNLTYSATGLPPTLTINSSTGLITGTIRDVSPYQVEVTVVDNNVPASTYTTDFTWLVNNSTSNGPTAVATATPQAGNSPLEVNFTGSNSTDANGITGYLWQFGDVLSSQSNAANPSFTYTQEGIYTASLIVTVADGSTSFDTVQITVESETSYTVTSTAGSNGTITPSGDTNVIEGSNQEYIITADAGFLVANIVVDNVSVGVEGSYTFTNVIGNHTIEGLFTQINNDPPMALATANLYEGDAPLSIEFDGSGSTDEIGIVGYAWNFGDGSALNTTISPSFVYTEPGVYNVILSVEDSDGIITTSTITITVNVSTEQELTETEGLLIYPNPASDEITLALPNSLEIVSISLFDISGKYIQTFVPTEADQNSGYSINIGALSTGIYGVKVLDIEGNESQQKLLKRR